MIDNRLNVLALREVLASCVAASTGEIELASTATTYTRTSGSFIADGFVVGMEVVPSGFLNAEPRLITGINALELTTRGGGGVEQAQAGRSLLTGIPPLCAWEGMEFDPIDGRWYIDEDYLPGPASTVTIGRRAQIEADPVYVLKMFSPIGYGIAAPYILADTILNAFPPTKGIPLESGDVLRVRSNPAPYRGQLTTRTGKALIVVTIPLRLRTTNII